MVATFPFLCTTRIFSIVAILKMFVHILTEFFDPAHYVDEPYYIRLSSGGKAADATPRCVHEDRCIGITNHDKKNHTNLDRDWRVI